MGMTRYRSIPACCMPCMKPRNSPTIRWAKPMRINDRYRFRSDRGSSYCLIAARLISLLPTDEAAAHEVVAGAAVLMAHEHVRAGLVEGVRDLGHVAREDHGADRRVLDLDAMGDVVAVDVERHRRTGRNTDFPRFKRPHPRPHVHFVAAGRQLA